MLFNLVLVNSKSNVITIRQHSTNFISFKGLTQEIIKFNGYKNVKLLFRQTLKYDDLALKRSSNRQLIYGET